MIGIVRMDEKPDKRLLFSFQKYVQPIWYYHLNKSHWRYKDIGNATEAVINSCIWENMQIGVDLSKKNMASKTIHTISGIEENYCFLKRYFHPFWVWYVFFIRIVQFKNPIKEIRGIKKSASIQRKNIFRNNVNYSDYSQYDSKLINSHVRISVIIPTLNRYSFLKDALIDLENQSYKNFDVIVVDQSEPFDPNFFKQFKLKIKVVHQEQRLLWLARNRAIKLSDSDYLLLFDDDSRVEADWIKNHLKCLDYFDADISSGFSISKIGAKVPSNYQYFRFADQLDTGNVMIRRSVFEKTGLFDEQFEKQRMGDGEFGLRSVLAGFNMISNPLAKRFHLKVESGGLREMGSWDAFRPKKWLAPRPIPSVLYLYRRYYGKELTFYALLKTIPLSIMPYRFKRNVILWPLFSLLGVLLLPLLLIQVVWSWKLASIKISEGPKIEYLKN